MKTNKIIYWITTGIFSAFMLMSAYMYLSHNAKIVEAYKEIGFPLFFANILGTAKLLGAIGILQPLYPKLKEWAYAGFTFVLIGAISTHIITSTSFVPALLFTLILATSYYFNMKEYSAKA